MLDNSKFLSNKMSNQMKYFCKTEKNGEMAYLRKVLIYRQNKGCNLFHKIAAKYPKRGSNPHGLLGQGILSPSCLPIPPSGQTCRSRSVAAFRFWRAQRYVIFSNYPIISTEKCNFCVQKIAKCPFLMALNWFFVFFCKKKHPKNLFFQIYSLSLHPLKKR